MQPSSQTAKPQETDPAKEKEETKEKQEEEKKAEESQPKAATTPDETKTETKPVPPKQEEESSKKMEEPTATKKEEPKHATPQKKDRTSMQVKQFENLKTLLKSNKSKQGGDLHGHLQEVFKRLIMHFPSQALDKLEEVSYLVKNNDKLNIGDFLNVEEKGNFKEYSENVQDFIQKVQALFKVTILLS